MSKKVENPPSAQQKQNKIRTDQLPTIHLSPPQKEASSKNDLDDMVPKKWKVLKESKQPAIPIKQAPSTSKEKISNDVISQLIPVTGKQKITIIDDNPKAPEEVKEEQKRIEIEGNQNAPEEEPQAELKLQFKLPRNWKFNLCMETFITCAFLVLMLSVIIHGQARNSQNYWDMPQTTNETCSPENSSTTNNTDSPTENQIYCTNIKRYGEILTFYYSIVAQVIFLVGYVKSFICYIKFIVNLDEIETKNEWNLEKATKYVEDKRQEFKNTSLWARYLLGFGALIREGITLSSTNFTIVDVVVLAVLGCLLIFLFVLYCRNMKSFGSLKTDEQNEDPQENA